METAANKFVNASFTILKVVIVHVRFNWAVKAAYVVSSASWHGER